MRHSQICRFLRMNQRQQHPISMRRIAAIRQVKFQFQRFRGHTFFAAAANLCAFTQVIIVDISIIIFSRGALVVRIIVPLRRFYTGINQSFGRFLPTAVSRARARARA